MEHQNPITHQRRVSSAEKLATLVTVMNLIPCNVCDNIKRTQILEQLVLVAGWPRAQLLEPRELRNGPQVARPQMTSALNAVRQGIGRQVFDTLTYFG